MDKPFAQMFGHNLSILSHKPDDTFVLPDCVTGIELELENLLGVMCQKGHVVIADRERYVLTSPLLNTWWDAHHDGSLREGGIEFVSRQLFGKDLLESIYALEKFLNELEEAQGKKFIRKSRRCSLHIHIDYRDFSLEELIAMYVLYAIVERMLFNYISPERVNNIYTVPLFKLNEFSNVLGELYHLRNGNQEDLRDRMAHFNNDTRYSAINLHAMVKYGSIEYRHSKATWDSTTIINWINILQSLKKYSKGKTPEEVLKSLRASKGRELFDEVFGTKLADLLVNNDYYQLKQDLRLGKRVAKKIFIHSQFTQSTNDLLNNIRQLPKTFSKSLITFLQSARKNFTLSYGVINIIDPSDIRVRSIYTIEALNDFVDAAVSTVRLAPKSKRAYPRIADMMKAYRTIVHGYKDFPEQMDYAFDAWIRSTAAQPHLAHIADYRPEDWLEYGFNYQSVPNLGELGAVYFNMPPSTVRRTRAQIQTETRMRMGPTHVTQIWTDDVNNNGENT